MNFTKQCTGHGQWKESSPGSIFLNLINFAFQMRGKAFKHLAAWAVLATGLVMSSGCSKTEPEAVAPRHTINVHWALSPGGLGDMDYSSDNYGNLYSSSLSEFLE